MIRRLARMGGLLGGLAVAVVAVWLLAEALRPPGVPTSDEPLSDPRLPVVCPDEAPHGELVTSGQLYDCPHLFDGVRVQYRGEVVGAVLERGDEAWVQLNDDVYAGNIGPLPAHRDFRGGNAGVGVRIDAETARSITHVGGPRARGDIVAVTGEFLRVDETTGEVAIIRSFSAEIVELGGPSARPFRLDRAVVAAALLVGLAVLWRIDVRRERAR